MSTNNNAKYVIIGGGISGLYTAYNIRKKNSNADITILEKEKIGGRMGLKIFYGAKVPIGAGIVRLNDKLLLALIKELKIPIKKIPIDSYSTFKRLNILKYLNILRAKYKTNKISHLTFKQFAKKILKSEYNLFIKSSGFSDYEREDIKRTLYCYNMEDNIWNGSAYKVDWNLLLDTLINKINATIKIEEVLSFKEVDGQITVNSYICDYLIIATAADSLHKLIRGYEYICGQPFLRMYAKFNYSPALINKMNELNTHCIITDGPLQKIIPIDIKKGIYMISYSDNAHALALKPYIKNTAANRKHFEKLFNSCIFENNNQKKMPTIKELWGKYWECGTHYFKPTDKKVIQVYRSNIFIVGEMISNHQGWTEGALDSVEKIKKYL